MVGRTLWEAVDTRGPIIPAGAADRIVCYTSLNPSRRCSTGLDSCLVFSDADAQSFWQSLAYPFACEPSPPA